MKIRSFLVVIALFGCIASYAQQSGLDGRQFKILLATTGTADTKETLVFDNGMMDPLDCHQWGFTATAYQAKNAAGMSTFRVICKTEKEGTMSWEGKVTGDTIEGSVSWKKEGQAPIYYTFKGTAETTKK